MLKFSDAPYRFFPSKPLAPLIAASRVHNRLRALPSKIHRITQINVQGATQKLGELRRKPGSRFLFVANHHSHSDPQTLTEVQRRLGLTTCFMAAYDVFLRSKVTGWIMQRNGAFSVDRESSDRKSMAAAVGILASGKHGLSVFPEGNVHFTNDRVTPFLDGAAFIAVRAQKSLQINGTVYVVPIALKFTHLTDVRPRVFKSLSNLAQSVGADIDPSENPVQELLRIGRLILVHLLAEHGFLTGEEESELLGSSCLFELLNQSASRIVDELEAKIGLGSKPGDSRQDRIRRIRSTIRQILSDPKSQAGDEAARAWSDEATLALRILGYGTPYASDKPTLDRFAETVEKLNEDLFNRITPEPFGERAAIAHICEPIDLNRFLASGESKTRTAVSTLTKNFESSIQSALDGINASLSTPGSQPF